MFLRPSIPLPVALFTHAAPTLSTYARRLFLNWLKLNRHILLLVLESVRRNLISRTLLLERRRASSEPQQGTKSHKKKNSGSVFWSLSTEYFVHFVPYCGY